jgi:hypothetical protein
MQANFVKNILAVVGVSLPYGLLCWRMFGRFRGDKFIEWASITTLLLAVVMGIYRIPNVPSWVMKAIIPLMFLSCWLSVYFGLQQAYHAIRHRRSARQDERQAG